MLFPKRLLLLFIQIILGLSLTSSLVSCSAFSSDDDDETVLESELDAEDELNGELNDVELIEDEDDDLDISEEDDEDDEELEDIDNEEAEDLDEEVADNDLDDEDDDEDLEDLDDDDDDEDDFDDEFADADDEDVDETDEDDEFSDEDLETDEEALAKELGGKDQEYPENADTKPVFPEEVVQKEGAVPSQPPADSSGVITSQTIAGPIEPPEPTVPQDDLGMADPIVPVDDQIDTNGWVPVVKVKEDPFFRNSRLMNAVYIARPGDTVQTISDKIYGEDKSQTLLQDNGHLDKGIDPGDKVYYTSPNRPNDKTSLKVFYADKNLQPQNYTTKSGDNMRRLGSKLLGFSEGWKEIWAINPNVDSKTVLKQGTDLRYWTGDEQTVEQMMMAKAEAEKPQDVVAEPEPPVDNQPPPPVVSELPPEPALPEASQVGMQEAMAGDPLPEPVEPLPEAEISQVPDEIGTEGGAAIVSNDDSLLTMGVIGLLVLAGVALIAIQIKNRKAQTVVSPPSLEYTQV